MNPLKAISQRLADHRRERRIRTLRAEAVRLLDIDKAAAREAAIRLFDECEQRSPQQIARMERDAKARLDPHARAVYERQA